MNPFDLASKYKIAHPLEGLKTNTSSTKSADSFSLADKYGLKHPLMGQEEEESSSFKLASQMKYLNTNITNYATRLNSVGEPIPEPEKPVNKLLKVLSYLDRPRAALWNGLHDALTEGQSFGEAAMEGLTGKENYTGGELLHDITGTDNGLVKGIGGFAAEVLGDPLNFVTLGLGSAAKGALTGAGKLGAEGAEMLSRAGLKDVTQEGAEAVGRTALKASGEEATKEAVERATKEAMVGQYDNVLSKYGIKMNHPDDYANIDDVIRHAREQLSTSIAKSSDLAAQQSRGISVGTRKHNLSIVSGETMEKLGSKLRDVPLLGTGLKTLSEIGSKIFNPKYIHGLDTAGREVAYNIKRDATGAKSLADEQLTGRFNDYAKALGKLGAKEAEKQDKLIRRFIEGAEDISVIRPELHKMVQDMKDDFMKWGAKEEDLGLLKNMFDENYFPRVKNWDNAERISKGGLTEKLKINNPSAYGRKYNMQTAELANAVMKFKTSSVPLKEEFGLAIEKALRGADIEDLKPIVEKLTRNPVNENVVAEAINAGLKANVLNEKGILALTKQIGLDGVDDFFETSAVKGWISRGLRHNQIIADNDFLRGTLNGFGNRVNNLSDAYKAAEEGLTVVVPKSSLDLYRISLNQDIKLKQGLKQAGKETGEKVNRVADEGMEITRMSDEVKAVVKSLISDTPEAFKTITPEQLEILQRYGGTALFGKQNLIEAYAIPKGVADSLRSAVAKQMDAGTEALGNIIDGFYRLWKPTVTGLRPDYHIRNFMGNTMNNMLNVGFKALDPRIQQKALHIMGKGEGEIILNGEKLTAKEIREAMTQNHASNTLQVNEFDDLNRSLNAQFRGATGGNIKEAVKHPLNTAARVGSAAGKAVETQGRTVNFLANVEDALEKGLTKQEAFRYAGEQVNKYLFDYTQLTKVEKDVFRRIMPFYTWMRKNVPLQLENFLNKPSFYSKFYQLKDNMEVSNGVDSSNMPEWMQGDLPIPLGGPDENGKVNYLDVSPPQADLARFNDPLKSLMTMLSPLIKVPVETYMNRTMLTGAPLYNNEYEKKQKILENILGQFGVIRDVGNARAAITGTTNNDKTVANTDLPGIMSSGLLRSYDPAYGEKDMLQQYNRDLGNLLQHLKDSGLFIPESTRDAKKFAQLSDAEKQEFIKAQAAKSSKEEAEYEAMTDEEKQAYINGEEVSTDAPATSRDKMLRNAFKAMGITTNSRQKAITQAKKQVNTEYKNGGL